MPYLLGDVFHISGNLDFRENWEHRFKEESENIQTCRYF